MSTARRTTALLLLSSLILQLATTANSIGVNYGTLGNNLPPPAQVANFLKTRTSIDAIKIFNTNPDILRGFANTNIAVTVSTGNGDIPNLAKLPVAKDWVAKNIAPFYPATKMIRIVLGNEIMQSGNKEWIYNLVPAMKTLHLALEQAGFKDIKVSTPNTLGFLQNAEPPSEGTFRVGYDKEIIAPMLQFFRETKSALMINAYPFFNYSPNVANYALFKFNHGIYDKNTKINYYNMFEAQMDAVYSAMKKLGYADVPIVVAETGWPSAGDPDQPAATVENAVSYNGNLIKHVTSGKGTPLMRNQKFETYMFSLFNENQKPGKTSERNFGLFKPDMTPAYDVGLITNGQSGAKQTSKPAQAQSLLTSAQSQPAAGKKFCVAKQDADDKVLRANIDYVCGKGIDCKPIQAGGACFEPNTVKAHASYAMNAYYSANGQNDVNCDFNKSGFLSTQNPSKDKCVYA